MTEAYLQALFFFLIAIITCADITCKENEICHEERPKAKCIKGKPLLTIFRVVSRKQPVNLSLFFVAWNYDSNERLIVTDSYVFKRERQFTF